MLKHISLFRKSFALSVLITMLITFFSHTLSFSIQLFVNPTNKYLETNNYNYIIFLFYANRTKSKKYKPKRIKKPAKKCITPSKQQ